MVTPVINHNLERLYKWLNIELPGIVLLVLSFYYNVTFYVFLAAAVIFTPFMLKILYEEKRYGWIIFFVLFVLLPGLFFYCLFGDIPALGPGVFSMDQLFAGSQILTSSVFIGLYLFYCYLLKLSLPGMMDE